MYDLEDWRAEHGDLAALLTVACSVVASGILAAYMNLSELNSGRFFVTDVFGAQLYLNPVGTGVLLTGLVSGEVYLVFRMERSGAWSEGAVLFSFSLLSGLLALLFARSFADAYFPNSGDFLVTVVGSGVFISIFLTFLIVIGEYSEFTKNLLLLVFGSTIGAFFSLIIPPVAVLGILAVVIAVDTVMTYARSKDLPENEPTKLSLTTRDWGIGLGDIIVFCTVVDTALIVGGAYAYIFSSALLFAGLELAMKLGRREKFRVLPGTLLGALPASIPILIVLATFVGLPV